LEASVLKLRFANSSYTRIRPCADYCSDKTDVIPRSGVLIGHEWRNEIYTRAVFAFSTRPILLKCSLTFKNKCNHHIWFLKNCLRLTKSFLESISLIHLGYSQGLQSKTASSGRKHSPISRLNMEGGNSSGTGSERYSSHESEDIMSMFFDFSSPAPGSTRTLDLSTVGQSQNQEIIQRGGVRVSLACVPVSFL
jgi:hypothetical protein